MRRTFPQFSLPVHPFRHVTRSIAVLLLAVAGFNAQAQTVITTTGAAYSGAGLSGAPGAVTFTVSNSNTTGVLLTSVGTYRATADPVQAFTLWYHPTQITGAPTIDAINGWIQIAQGATLAVPTTNGIVDVISGLSFYIPPAPTTYRFALTASAGNIHYSGTTAAPAAPNSFSGAGIDLLVSDNAFSPGYAGTAPSPNILNGAFTGRVTFAAPCSGPILAGNLTPGGVVGFCAGASFTITRFGGTQASGFTYQWEQAAPGAPGWSNVVGGSGANTPTYTTPVLTDTVYYRLRVTCASSGQSATTNPVAFNRANFFTCYCPSTALQGAGRDIGRVVIHRASPGGDTTLNSGTGTPIVSNTTAVNGYTNFQATVPAAVLYRDSLYRTFVQQISQNTTNVSSIVAAWIDFDQNAIFNANELIYSRPTLASSTPPWSITDTFRIPTNAPVGLTGMRLVLQEGAAQPSACGNYNFGETEDYLVRVAFPPCNGPANAGTAMVSDTLLCPGFPFILTDSSYERQRSLLQRVWETSINGGLTWTIVPNSANKDTLSRVYVAAAQYRLRLVCTASNDTTYSNVVNTTTALPYACYCYSSSPGSPAGPADSTDIGSFRIGSFVVNSPGGPHLQNPAANRGRTNYTNLGFIELMGGKKYGVNVYQIIRSAVHRDAKITMFIDFNQNGSYEPPRERVLTGFTTANNWYFIDSISIPIDSFIADTPTGMRVIISDNINPNAPSDQGCGIFTSGETEDYVVILRNQFSPTDVSSTNNALRGLAVYPNPTSARTIVTLRTNATITDAQLTVSDMTGRVLTQQNLEASGGEARAEVDMSGQSRGVYFVEVRAGGERLVKKLVVQ